MAYGESEQHNWFSNGRHAEVNYTKTQQVPGHQVPTVPK
jgi:hypothetical protein